jgi:outer membrane lipoprotein SlyB
MKSLLAALSLAAGLAASPAPCAQDFGGVDQRVALGTVQHVKVVQVERDIHAFDERAFELRIQPDLAEELVIRLDAGDIVTVTVQGAQRFAPGERVRVVSQTYSPYGPQVEHE